MWGTNKEREPVPVTRDADERRDCGLELFVPRLRIGVLQPERLDGLVGEHVVPMI